MGKLIKNKDGTFTIKGGFSSKKDGKMIAEAFLNIDSEKPKKGGK